MQFNRRDALKILTSITTLPMIPAQAAGFPTRRVTLLVVFPAGGPGDLLARQLAPALSDKWKVPVIVENKPGGAGSVAASAVLREAADGHTLLCTSTTHIQASALGMKLAYDPLTDFAAITPTALAPMVLMVRPDGPKTLDELVARAKSSPMAFASFGAASTAQIYGEIFNKVADVKVTNVPYQGGAPAVSALLGGHVDASFVEATQALAQMRGGRLHPIAVAGTKRFAGMPDVKTFKELGMKSFELVGWHGVMAKKGTPSNIADQIAADIREVLTKPSVSSFLASMGVEPFSSTPQEWGLQLNKELQDWTELIRQSGVTSTQ